MLGLCPRPLQGASSRTRSKLSGGYGGPAGDQGSVHFILDHTVNEHVCSMWCDATFSFLCRVTANSLNTVEAIGLDGTQTEHLSVMKNSINLITDPVQSHHFTL